MAKNVLMISAIVKNVMTNSKEHPSTQNEHLLVDMRRFYLAFEKRDAVRLELSWTHYRTLLRIDNSSARNWYRDEAILQNWSARSLERQIGTLYYERLLSSKEKQALEQEAQQNTQVLAESAKYLAHLPSEEEQRI